MSQVRTKRYYPQDNTTRKQIRFGELFEEIQKVCDGNFSGWVKQACAEKLERDRSKPRTDKD